MNSLKRVLSVCLLAAALIVYAAGSVDLLKGKVNWKRLSQGKGLTITRGKTLTLTNRHDSRLFGSVSLKYDIDLTATPYLFIEVENITDHGEVKLICGKKKVSVLHFSQPGVHQVDAAKKLNLSGKQRIEVCVYTLGGDSMVCYKQIKFNSKKVDTAPREPAFYIKPTFINAAYYFRSSDIGVLTPYFKKAGSEKWTAGVNAYFDAEKKQYRGSIVRLEQNTAYDFKLSDKNGKSVKTGSFKTWADKVKVARTIVLDPAKIKKTLVITSGGKPDGWIRYTQKPGTVLTLKEQKTVIRLAGAKYILLDGLNIKGGHKHAIEVNGCRNVRIRNCEITGWGIVGEQRCDYNGRFHVKGQAPSGYGINMNGAINIIRGEGIVVERCYIHDPRNRANSWFYSHPAGPQAVTVGSPDSCVIRYNDFVGSDERRYNDAVESLGNFSKDGGLNRDADIYGNFMIYCSDDNIELDGGQQNVRCFDNRFEGSFCGVSIQGCMTGPSYVFDNIFLNMGDEFGAVGYTLKSCAGPHWGGLSRKNASYIFNNTFTGPGQGTNIDVFMDYRNNIWGGERKIDGVSQPHTGASNIFEKRARGVKYNMKNTRYGRVDFAGLKAGDLRLAENSRFKGTGTAIPNFTAADKVDPGAFHASPAQPARPLPVCVQPQQLNYTCKGKAVSAAQSVTVKGVCPKFSGKFVVRKNEVADWFEVTPSQGVIKDGNELKLQVRIKPGFTSKYRKYRGAFLVRFENGLSRPVSVYLDTDYKAPAYPEKAGVKNIYIDFTKVSRGKQYAVVPHPDGGRGSVLKFSTSSYSMHPKEFKGTAEDIAEYDFDIPADGTYFLMIRGCRQGKHPIMDACFMALDDAPLTLQSLTLTFSDRMSWVWPQLPEANKKIHECKALKLKKGRHVLKIAPRKPLYFDSFCITTDPRIFEDR
ncbi:MAG: right-handed parallel beta-helix repeat-containing protein [Lentisphaeria bacterium]|nr:right-handed parallel beta-helix repeat-containing protein [Lentisphaeria bacterium]